MLLALLAPVTQHDFFWKSGSTFQNEFEKNLNLSKFYNHSAIYSFLFQVFQSPNLADVRSLSNMK